MRMHVLPRIRLEVIGPILQPIDLSHEEVLHQCVTLSFSRHDLFDWPLSYIIDPFKGSVAFKSSEISISQSTFHLSCPYFNIVSMLTKTVVTLALAVGTWAAAIGNCAPHSHSQVFR